MTTRAVLATSALVPLEKRRTLHSLAVAGACTPLWSPWIIAELNRVLTWRWIERSEGDVARRLSQRNWQQCSTAAKTMMVLLHSTFERVDPRPPYPPPWEHLTDQWDHPIWAAAKLSGAQYVVSENIHDYPPRDRQGRPVYEGIAYISATAFVAMVTDG